MKIALWGYGQYGRELHERIRTFWSAQYEIVALFDREYESLSSTTTTDGLLVQNPDELEACYRRGDFEAVICCVMTPSLFREMLKSLDAKGVPRIRLGKREDFKPSLGCAGSIAQPGLRLGNPGYELREIHDLFAIRGAHSQEMLYLYAADGRLLDDNWFESDFSIYPGILDHPLPATAMPDDAPLLEGEYCVTSRCFGANYWHFTFECLDQVVLMERAGFSGTYIAIRTPFSRDLMRLVGIPDKRVLWVEDFEEFKPFRLEKAFIASSPGEKRYSARTPEVLEVAERVLRNLPPAPLGREYPRRLFVKRIASRRLLGAEALLERYGFVTMVVMSE